MELISAAEASKITFQSKEDLEYQLDKTIVLINEAIIDAAKQGNQTAVCENVIRTYTPEHFCCKVERKLEKAGYRVFSSYYTNDSGFGFDEYYFTWRMSWKHLS